MMEVEAPFALDGQIDVDEMVTSWVSKTNFLRKAAKKVFFSGPTT